MSTFSPVCGRFTGLQMSSVTSNQTPQNGRTRSWGAQFFGWQDGYGAFSVSSSDLEELKQYIRDQRNHHRKKTFKEEYLDLLRSNGVDFDERFLWE
jgi:hypothetical protein